MDQLLGVIESLAKHPILHLLSLQQLIELLTLISQLKRSILLVKHAAEPTNEPPDILPCLIQRFIAESIRIEIQAIADAWSILKGYAWTMPTISECAEQEKEAFRSHGWNKGLSECANAAHTSILLMALISQYYALSTR
jgi:hypothetical protein